ncbi:MAG: phosphatidate cytidylyltransferase [Gemmobacter sp.]
MIRGRFGDLLPRLGSALVLVAVGALDLWVGGAWFLALVALIVGAMLWELAHLVHPAQRAPARAAMGLAGASAIVSGALTTPAALAVPLAALLPALVALAALPAGRRVFALYGSLAVLAGLALWHVRASPGGDGLGWTLWLIAVVVASDAGGYFVGRIAGGPKFWPRVSPSKTWSGTLAGWVGAAAVGGVGAGMMGLGGGALVGATALAVVLACAAQAGDLWESALKRRAGVKDSSNLIPGHGGVMDRFDGMIGAAALMGAVALATGFPLRIAG